MFEILSSPWIPVSLLIGLALVARIIRRSWLSPSAFIALIWAVYATGCLLLTDYEVYPLGVWVIVLFVFSVQFGTLLSEGTGAVSQEATQASGFEANTLRVWSDRSLAFTVLFTIVAMAGAIYLLMYSLEKYSLGFSFLELLSLGHLWSVDRYAGDVEPWPVRLTIMWVYPAALLAGICCATSRRRIHKYLSFAPLVPAALIGTLFAARAGLLFSTVCWLSGFLAIRYLENGGKFALFQKKFVISMLTLVICGFVFFVAVDSLRIFQNGDDMQVRLEPSRIYKYCFGSIPAFSTWLHFGHRSDAAWGAYTFSGVFDLLGIKQRQIGVYDEYLTLAGGEDVNIYTFLRGLIEDFTLAGACVFGVLFGIVAGYAGRGQTTTHLLILAGYYAFVLFSPIISLFAYNGLILAWAVTALVLGLRLHQAVRTVRPAIIGEC
jgi:oligosaccharide repeat unit polymerase